MGVSRRRTPMAEAFCRQRFAERCRSASAEARPRELAGAARANGRCLEHPRKFCPFRRSRACPETWVGKHAKGEGTGPSVSTDQSTPQNVLPRRDVMQRIDQFVCFKDRCLERPVLSPARVLFFAARSTRSLKGPAKVRRPLKERRDVPQLRPSLGSARRAFRSRAGQRHHELSPAIRRPSAA